MLSVVPTALLTCSSLWKHYQDIRSYAPDFDATAFVLSEGFQRVSSALFSRNIQPIFLKKIEEFKSDEPMSDDLVDLIDDLKAVAKKLTNIASIYLPILVSSTILSYTHGMEQVQQYGKILLNISPIFFFMRKALNTCSRFISPLKPYVASIESFVDPAHDPIPCVIFMVIQRIGIQIAQATITPNPPTPIVSKDHQGSTFITMWTPPKAKTPLYQKLVAAIVAAFVLTPVICYLMGKKVNYPIRWHIFHFMVELAHDFAIHSPQSPFYVQAKE